VPFASPGQETDRVYSTAFVVYTGQLTKIIYKTTHTVITNMVNFIL